MCLFILSNVNTVLASSKPKALAKQEEASNIQKET